MEDIMKDSKDNKDVIDLLAKFCVSAGAICIAVCLCVLAIAFTAGLLRLIF